MPPPVAQPRSVSVRRRGLTLIEIVCVLMILALLGVIGASMAPKLIDGAKIKRARADLHVIQQALEAYKARFGDYPRVTDDTKSKAALGEIPNVEAVYLLNALNGQIGPAGDRISGVPSMLNNALLTFGKNDLPYPIPGQTNVKTGARIVDPWGSPYRYAYDPTAKNDQGESTWQQFGYRLYSFGTDRSEGGGDDVVAQ